MSAPDEKGIAHQRYYYGVILDFQKGADLKTVRRYAVSAVAPNPWIRNLKLEDSEAFGWRTRSPLGASENHKHFKVKLKNGQSAYHYDFLATSIRLRRRGAILLSFPFVGCGKLVIAEMVEQGVLRDALFIRANVQTVVDAVRKGEALDGRVRVAKLVTRVEDDAVRRLAIGGHDAVHSRIYRLLLREFGEATFGARHCILNVQTKDLSRRVSAHLDNFGNYSFWLQSGLKNAGVLPEMFRYLDDLNAIEESTAIPFERLELTEELGGAE
jgi:hypothetical protein